MYDGDTPTWTELYADDYRAAHEDAMIAQYGICECGNGIAFHDGICADCWADAQADYAMIDQDRYDTYGNYGSSDY